MDLLEALRFLLPLLPGGGLLSRSLTAMPLGSTTKPFSPSSSFLATPLCLATGSGTTNSGSG